MILQGLLGMWTVTLLLKPLIVVLHLLGGLATLSLLAWLAHSHAAPDAPQPCRVRDEECRLLQELAAVGLVVLGAADRAGRLDQQQLRGARLPRFPDLSEFATGRTWT